MELAGGAFGAQLKLLGVKATYSEVGVAELPHPGAWETEPIDKF